MNPARLISNKCYEFFFKPQSCEAISLFRIFVACITLTSCLILAPDLLVWFSDNGWPQPLAPDPFRLSLFNLFAAGTTQTLFVYSLLVLSSFMMMLGIATRLSTFLVWLCLISFVNSFPFSCYGIDRLLAIYSFFLIFSPCDEEYSLDKLIWQRRKKTKTVSESSLIETGSAEAPNGVVANDSPSLRAPWAQRLIQIQIAAIYWQAFWAKVAGQTWLDGSAIYYVLNLAEVARVPMPFLRDQIWISQFLSWFTLVVECALWLLVWIRKFRYWILTAGVFLHIGIDLGLNIPLFSCSMISGYLLFIDNTHLQVAVGALRGKLKPAKQNLSGSET